MTFSFKTTIRDRIKKPIILLIIGVICIIPGVSFLFFASNELPNILIHICGISFIICGILRFIFYFQNRNVFIGWGFYMIYGILIIIKGIFLIIYESNSFKFLLGNMILFRAIVFLLTAVDLMMHGIRKWKSIALWSILGIILSLLILFEKIPVLYNHYALSVTFISIGIASVILYNEFNQINKYYKVVKKLS